MADQINITSEDDYSDCVKKFNYEIVRPDIDDMDITANYDYPTGRYDYPVINEGNLHLRKDHHFYLNFFDTRYTGVIRSWAEGTIDYYFLDGVLVYGTHHRFFDEGKTLAQRWITKNGDLFEDSPMRGSRARDTKSFVASTSEKLTSPNEWYFGNFSNIKEFHDNGVLKRQKRSSVFDFLGGYDEYIYYSDGPLKEVHSYDQNGHLTEKKYSNRSYIYPRDGHPPTSFFRIEKYDPEHGSLHNQENYFSEECGDQLRNDKEFILAALKDYEWGHFPITHISKKMLTEKEIILELIKKLYDELQFLIENEGLEVGCNMDDPEILTAITQQKNNINL